MNAAILKAAAYILHTGVRVKRFVRREDGSAAIEAALLFPILMVILMGMVDIGDATLTNQKVISGSQLAADLLARDSTASTSDIDNAVEAARLALMPYPTASFGIDIASIQFDEDGAPVVLWRVTRNMAANDVAVESSEAIGAPGEGVLIVTVQYQFEPTFSGHIIGPFTMQEVAFVRGRKSPTVTRV
jgi:Flp pilus assembly protein TadG